MTIDWQIIQANGDSVLACVPIEAPVPDVESFVNRVYPISPSGWYVHGTHPLAVCPARTGYTHVELRSQSRATPSP